MSKRTEIVYNTINPFNSLIMQFCLQLICYFYFIVSFLGCGNICIFLIRKHQKVQQKSLKALKYYSQDGFGFSDQINYIFLLSIFQKKTLCLIEFGVVVEATFLTTPLCGITKWHTFCLLQLETKDMSWMNSHEP